MPPSSIPPGPAALDDLIALLPAAGRARRLGPIPGSKEVLPLVAAADSPDRPPVTALERLLSHLSASGVRRALILLREGKEDIPARVGSGTRHGVAVAYRVLEETGSPVETLAAAAPFLTPEDRVALAFPDILYHPPDAFARLAREQAATGAAVVLGLFPCAAPERSDMVELGDDGSVRAVRIKGPDVGLRWAWGQAVWDSRFTALLLRTLHEHADHPEELQPGHVVQRALAEGLPVRAVPFDDGVFLDIGTPEGLEKAKGWLGTDGP